MGINVISEKLGVSRLTVWKDVQALGLPMRKPGRQPQYADHGPRKCARAGCGRWFHPKPSLVARGYGKYHSLSCAYTDRWWRTGNGISQQMLENAARASGHRRPDAAPNLVRKFKGRWGSNRPPKAGGRPRGRPHNSLPPGTLARVERLLSRGFGRRTIAQMTGVSEHTIRRIQRRSAAP
jgi:hypothetical protein